MCVETKLRPRPYTRIKCRRRGRMAQLRGKDVTPLNPGTVRLLLSDESSFSRLWKWSETESCFWLPLTPISGSRLRLSKQRLKRTPENLSVRMISLFPGTICRSNSWKIYVWKSEVLFLRNIIIIQEEDLRFYSLKGFVKGWPVDETQGHPN